jgi:hypothetical protein
VELIPLKEVTNIGLKGVDNYLIVITQENRFEESNHFEQATLQEAIEAPKKIEDGEQTISRFELHQHIILRNNIFKHIFSTSQPSQQTSLAKFMSLNPRHIIFSGSAGSCNINFDVALSRALRLS